LRTELYEHVAGTPGVLVVGKTPFLGALESLAECADPSWPHSEWHLDLLGFADLSTQARSEYGNVDVAADIGIWICAMCSGQHHYAVHRLDLQPHELGPGMLALALRLQLVMRVPVHAEWHRGTLQDWSWEEPGARARTSLGALRMFDTTWGSSHDQSCNVHDALQHDSTRMTNAGAGLRQHARPRLMWL